MNFITTDEFLEGSCFQGYVRTSLGTLLKHFGEPAYSDEYCPADWTVEFEDGAKAAIYIYGPAEHELMRGEARFDEYLWHVDGYSSDVVFRVAEVLGVEPILLSGDLPHDIPY